MENTKYGRLRDKVLCSNRIYFKLQDLFLENKRGYKHFPVSERLIQCIWNDQHVSPNTLNTVDGRSVKVIFPGWWNREAGPDFQNATIQIGAGEPVSGDVEIHLRSEDWSRHNHHLDPAYNDVILHVVYWHTDRTSINQTQSRKILPELVLEHQLRAPIETLYEEIDQETYPLDHGAHGDQCRTLLSSLPVARVHELLDSAGDDRFFTKMQRYVGWLSHIEPAQAFYEGWMEALGYKSNKLAFLTLAQNAPLTLLKQNQNHIEACLMGIANFLPTRLSTTNDPSDLNHVKSMWKSWWKLRSAYDAKILPKTLWQFHNIRPSNHPHRRVGAAAALIRKYPDLLEIFIAAVNGGSHLEQIFINLHDEYWEYHSTLDGKVQKRATNLIGKARSKEIIINVVLPFLGAYSKEIFDEKLLPKIFASYAALPLGPTNAVLRLASQHLFSSSHVARKRVTTARQQQGLFQLFHDFCINGRIACQKCRLPDLVACWNDND